jgi:predicted choloylglycine hydrolase
MKRLPAFFLISMLAFAETSAFSCTLWSAAGAASGGGTILSKNRDWRPGGIQTVRMVHPRTGYAYFALFAADNGEPGIKDGVNEKGLCVVSASAGSIPKKQRDDQPGASGKMRTILTRCADTNDVLKMKDRLFSNARAGMFMISDRSRIIRVEVGLKGRFAVQEIAEGFTTQTNHFVEEEMRSSNVKTGRSSIVRYERINELLQSSKRPFTVERFAEISRDRNGGPDNSLWRTGEKEKTLASWIIRTPPEGVPVLRLVILNPGQKETLNEYTLDAEFWKKRD